MRQLRGEIDEEVVGILPEDGRFERRWFRNLDANRSTRKVAQEILRKRQPCGQVFRQHDRS